MGAGGWLRRRIDRDVGRAAAKPLQAEGWVFLAAMVCFMGYYAVTGDPITSGGPRRLVLHGWAAHVGYGILAVVPAYVLLLNLIVVRRRRADPGS